MFIAAQMSVLFRCCLHLFLFVFLHLFQVAHHVLENTAMVNGKIKSQTFTMDRIDEFIFKDENFFLSITKQYGKLTTVMSHKLFALVMAALQTFNLLQISINQKLPVLFFQCSQFLFQFPKIIVRQLSDYQSNYKNNAVKLLTN